MTCNLQVIFHDNELIPTKKPITVDEPVSLGPLRSETQSHSSSLRPPFSSNLTTCSFQKRENEGFSLSLAFYFSVLRWLSFSFKNFSFHFTSHTLFVILCYCTSLSLSMAQMVQSYLWCFVDFVNMKNIKSYWLMNN